jgi:hypothetical protein
MEAGGQQAVSDGSTNKTMDHDKDTTNVCVYSNIFSDFTKAWASILLWNVAL